MRGFDKQTAMQKAIALTARNDGNRYEVAPYSYDVSNSRYTFTNRVATWGVGRYIPYCTAMPERFDGFVSF